jgi:hypothetical protein
MPATPLRTIRSAKRLALPVLAISLTSVMCPVITQSATAATPTSNVAPQNTDETPVAEDAPTRIVLTPTRTPHKSQNVTWLAGLEGETVGKVQIRTGNGATRTISARGQGSAINQPRQHFSATINDLRAGTTYSYRVGNGSTWSAWQSFTTADPSKSEFEYVYYGDAQVGLDATWPAVVKMAEEKAPNSIGSVHAGDLIDVSSNNSQWQSWFKGMEKSAATSNIMAAPGNHEYTGDRLMQSWKAHFEYPDNQPEASSIGELAERAVGTDEVATQYQAYFDHWSDFARETVYYTDYQGVRFITINATSDQTFLKPSNLPECTAAECPVNRVSALWFEYQAAWLDHVLTESPSKWNVVTFHQPVYSASAGRNEPQLRGPWVPVFQKHNIDLVQMGHDHVYARGYNNENRTDTDGVTNGPVYIVQNSGAKHYNLETDERNVWTNNGATQVRKGEDFSSFAVVKVTKDKLHYKSYIAERTATASTDVPVGEVWDEFVITKHDDGRKVVTEAGADVPEFDDVTPVPVIESQPADRVATKPGKTVRLSVKSSGENLTYQWQRARKGSSSWSDIENQDKRTLILEDVTANTGRYTYRVQVTSGTKSVVSNTTSLIVQGPSKVRVAKQSVRAGKKATVSVVATAAGKATVSVRVNGKTIKRTVTVKADRTTKVTLKKLSRKARGTAKITVKFTPADAAQFTASKAVRSIKVSR